MKRLLLLLLLIPAVSAQNCIDAYDQMELTRDTVLCSKTYDVPSGIRITFDKITLDCNGAIIRGTGLADGQGIIIESTDGVTVKNCNIINFDVGMYVKESNRNYLYDNTLLKNKVGIRLLQAFENRFENNADKSLLKPVSSIASKFNSFWLTNKNIDKDFCAVNLCNRAGPMNPCENDDFYCSPQCTYENDKDCPAPAISELQKKERPAMIFATPPAVTPQPAPAAPKATGTVPKSLLRRFSEKTRFWIITGLAIVVYLFTFLAFQHHHAHDD